MVGLQNLVKIELTLLDKCEQLPSLGHLPCLQILKMRSLGNVKRIGSEFYGREILDSARSSSGCSSEGAPITLFPALRTLKLRNMDNLVEWSDAAMISSDSSIKVFPNLQDLHLSGLNKLAILPDMYSLTCLQRLEIQSCRSLSCLRNLNSLTSLESLFIADCPNVDAALNVMDNPQSIRDLNLLGCHKLIYSLSNLDNFTSLVSLLIISDPEFWPKDLQHLPNLRNLILGGVFCGQYDFDYFPWPFSRTNVATTRKDDDFIKQHFISLEYLKLIGWPKIKSLPEQIQHLSALSSLSIREFDGLGALPEWLGNLRNLERLRVESCSNIEQLPSVEAMQRLTNLRWLHISQCPRLADRCSRGSGAEWHKIAHIPDIFVDNTII
ncbi:hypothetical protein ACH5RR_028633 [Cinchona calisaya]|uniref:R13L1/DRL21-like LRR repeat region domain-containing protein n=1 Tax=Cinchona calisaya TaxID=153742 RepID=A0ABD2YPD0_9GENT